MPSETPVPPPLPPRKSQINGNASDIAPPGLGQPISPPALPPRPRTPAKIDIGTPSINETPVLPAMTSHTVEEAAPVVIRQDQLDQAVGIPENPTAVSVDITPATPLQTSPVDTATPTTISSTPTAEIIHSDPSTSETHKSAKTPTMSPNLSPETALDTLPPQTEITKPPLPPRPAQLTPTQPFTTPTSPIPIPWILFTLSLTIIAYTRFLPLWFLLAGIGALVYFGDSMHFLGHFQQEHPYTEGIGSSGGYTATDARSVDWVNHALQVLFPLISTDVLIPFIDLMEDALIEQVPPIVTSVRLTSPSLGSTPMQLTSLRVMTDQEWFASISSAPGNSSSSSSSPSGGSSGGTPNPSQTPNPSKGHKRNISSLSSPSFLKNGNGSNKPRSSLSRNLSSSSLVTNVDTDHVVEETERRRKRDIIRNKLGRRRTDKSGEGVSDHTDVPNLSGGEQYQGQETGEEREGEGLGNVSRDKGGAKDAEEMLEGDPNAGHYVNYQVGFEYSRTNVSAKQGRGLHVLAYFGWGVKGIGTSEIPIYIDVMSVKGTLNVRLLLSATPPFAKTATISLPRIPQFDISAKPLTRSTFNAMEIPGMKTYVNASVKEVLSSFVRPEAYTVDVDRLLLGREASLRTESIGILQIMVHRAEGLPKTDTIGSCDPYVAISFSKFNKPVFSTRTIISSQNPSWGEPAYVLVSGDAISSGEKLRLRVCDSDRFSADDAIGLVEVDLANLIDETLDSTTSISTRRVDNLEADRPGMRVTGTLSWSVKFCPLWQMSSKEMDTRLKKLWELKKSCVPPVDNPWWLLYLQKVFAGPPDWAAERDGERKKTLAWFTGEKERDEMEVAERPNERLRSGILQFHIHQCLDLELESLEGTFSSAKNRSNSAAGGKPALADVIDRTPTENPDPPSAYCEVILNDRLVYRTRTKQVTPLPYFNAVSERFIRDWRMAKIVFVVRDERDREHDPILGIVSIPLRDTFRNSSQSTKWYPIVGGLGWGRIRISLLWKPIEIDLPPRISGFEIATVKINSLAATDLSHNSNKNMIVIIETEADRYVMSSGNASLSPSQPSFSANIDGTTPSPQMLSKRHSRADSISSMRSRLSVTSGNTYSGGGGGSDAPELEWDIHKPIRLAVEYRHSCSLVISFAIKQGVLKKKKIMGIALIRLGEIEDDVSTERTVPIWATGDIRAATKASQEFELSSFSNSSSSSGPSHSPQPLQGMSPGKNGIDGTLTPKLVGFVSIGFTLKSGCSRAHKRLCKRDLRFKHVYEAWELAKEVDYGMDRTRVGDTLRNEKDKLLHGDDSSSDDEEEVDEDSESSGVEGEEGVGNSGEPKANRRISMKSNKGKERDDVPLDSDEEDEEDQNFLARKKAHSHALHKRNKGIFQLKIARTGRFVKDKIQAKILSNADSMDRRPRGSDLEVEREGVSSI